MIKYKGYTILKSRGHWYVKCKSHKGLYIPLWTYDGCLRTIRDIASNVRSEGGYALSTKEEMERGE